MPRFNKILKVHEPGQNPKCLLLTSHQKPNPYSNARTVLRTNLNFHNIAFQKCLHKSNKYAGPSF